jgi:hypothetical protein
VTSAQRTRLIVGLVSLALVSGIAASAGCAPRISQEASNADAENTVTGTVWAPTIDCLVCHDLAEPNTLGTLHQDLGSSCLSCHEVAELQPIHDEHGDSVRVPAKLRYSSVAQTACLASGCHENREELAARTGEVSISDKNGLAVNPHELPNSESHDSLSCAKCHVAHEESVTLAVAEDECFGCHHEKVFECGTCHE